MVVSACDRYSSTISSRSSSRKCLVVTRLQKETAAPKWSPHDRYSRKAQTTRHVSDGRKAGTDELTDEFGWRFGNVVTVARGAEAEADN